MKYFEFQADQIYCEIDDNDLILCSFAEGDSPDPEKYLILQRIINEKDNNVRKPLYRKKKNTGRKIQ